MGRIRHLKIVLSALLLCAFASAFGQDSNQVRATIKVLSSSEMYGRGNCYNGEQKAAEYIQNMLLDLHAKPLGEKGFQKYSFPSHKMEGDVMVSIKGETLNSFSDYRIAPYAHSIHQEANIIHFQAKMLLSPERLESFREKNADKLSNSFVYIDIVKDQCKTAEERKQLQKAIQALEYNNPFQSLGILIGVEHLPFWGLSANYFERNYALIHILCDKMPQKVKSITINFTNEFITKQTQNVCFAIEGTSVMDSFVVLSAHYDHLGCMGDSVIFYGAHDNASGVAAVLDFAKYFSQNPPKYNMIFLLFSGEESGLKGSTFFAKHPLLPLDKIKLLINLDMFCGGDDGIMVVNSQSDETKHYYDKMLEINNLYHYVTDVKSRANAANSDHYPFTSKCPAIFIYALGGRSGGYHNYTDSCENCSLQAYIGIFKLINSLISEL